MEQTRPKTIDPIRVECGMPKTLAGLTKRYTMETRGEIPGLWADLCDYLGHIPAAVDSPTTYGVSSDVSEKGFDYFCGEEVSSKEPLSGKLVHLDIPAQRYAVFAHTEHLSTLCNTYDSIWGEWYPRSGLKAGDQAIEVYGPEFDPETLMGGIEVWIALQD